MLSIRTISRLLGKDILIYPFDEKKLKGIGYNLSVGSYGWSLRQRGPLACNTGGDSFLVDAGDTALIMTAETVWVSKRIGGTFHSKVDRVSEGFSSISTTLDPEWIGPLLIAITNMSSNQISLRKGDTLSTLVFHRIEKAPKKGQAGLNPAGRLDRLNALGITVSPEAAEWVSEEFRNNQMLLRENFLNSKEYAAVKKRFWQANFGERLRRWLPSILAAGAVLLLGRTAAPEQQVGPVIAALIAALAMALKSGSQSQ